MTYLTIARAATRRLHALVALVVSRVATRRLLALTALVASAAATAPLGAQSLANRVAGAGDGEVRMEYATRAGVCGDAKDVVALNRTLYVYPSMESHGTWSGVRCDHGRARVSITTSARQVERIRTYIGGAWTAPGGRVTDLGTVSAKEAAAYFFSIAEKMDGRSARNALLPAVIADSVDALPSLLRIAQRSSIADETRRRATHWLGELGDASMIGPLEQLARADDSEDGVGQAALYALSELPDGAGIPSLIRFARSPGSVEFRGKAVFWLGQADDKRAQSEVRAVAQDRTMPDEVREKAIFVIGQHHDSSDEDVAFLESLFPKLESAKLRDQVLFSVSQADNPRGNRWLLGIARDESVQIEVRKKALFWLAQKDDPEVTKVISNLVTGP